MSPFLLLAAWTLTGALVAAVLRLPGESRWGWTPLALVLGPLWVPVALDQRATPPPPDNSEAGR